MHADVITQRGMPCKSHRFVAYLAAYSGIFTKFALECLTGINRVQFSHCVSGFRNPRPNKHRKIEKALHDFADDLKHVQAYIELQTITLLSYF